MSAYSGPANRGQKPERQSPRPSPEGYLETGGKRKKLLDRYGEELLVRLPEWEIKLDQLELERTELAGELARTTQTEHDISDRLGKLRSELNPEAVQQIMSIVLFHMTKDLDAETMQPFIVMVRCFVQKVVIAKTPGHQPTELAVHGHIVSILAAMQAATIMEERIKAMHSLDYQKRRQAGELDTEVKRQKLLDRYGEELLVRFPEWEILQVCLVAEAGFEPAAFRL